MSLKQENIKSEPLAILVGFAALAAFGLSFAKGKAGKLGAGIASILCALSLFMMKTKVDQDVLKQTQDVVGIQWEFGFWMMLLAAIAAAVLAFLKVRPTATS